MIDLASFVFQVVASIVGIGVVIYIFARIPHR